MISTSAERTLSGRPSDHLQPFAMEFFMRFSGATPHADLGKKAKFRVTLVHPASAHKPAVLDCYAEVPHDADRSRLP